MELVLVVLCVAVAASYILWFVARSIVRPPAPCNWRAYQRVLEKMPAPRKRAKRSQR